MTSVSQSRAETHAERLQFPAQFDMIVDFAVEGDEKALIE